MRNRVHLDLEAENLGHTPNVGRSRSVGNTGSKRTIGFRVGPLVAALAVLATLSGLAACGRSAPDETLDTTPPSQTVVSTAPQPTSSTAATPAEQLTYVVQSGDSLSVIAQRFGVSTAALAEFNAIEDVNAVKVGQELRIPPADGTAPTSETTPTTAAVTTASS